MTTLEDKSIINKILDLKSKEYWWKTISETEKVSIEKGILDADNKKLNSNEKAK